jgi:transcriptional regulator with PAS, ATPase and Fis domain
MIAQQIKQRFEIIGQSHLLDRAIDTAIRVAPTELSVLITGESGTGKENFPKIIHQLSQRKHNKYIAVNCGAIPEGTIDSELFGHEKGSFTGAQNARSGYFEEATGGTIFLDEVAELPLQTQVRLLRVLETGEYIRVGSSKVQKTDVRIVAASNVNIPQAVSQGKFREDLYYRLNTVSITLPALRERKEDIHLLFRKFAADCAERYRMPVVRLSEDARTLLESYRWPGNIRQLKNVAEQLSVIETEREIDAKIMARYLPDHLKTELPVLYKPAATSGENYSERDLLYKVLFDLKQDVTDLKKLVAQMLNGQLPLNEESRNYIQKMVRDVQPESTHLPLKYQPSFAASPTFEHEPDAPLIQPHEEIVETLSLEEKEKELIQKALEKYKGRRKFAANELGISERTLYRKIKEYGLT